MNPFIVRVTYKHNGEQVPNTHRAYRHLEDSINLRKTKIEFMKRLEAQLSSEICYSLAWYNLIRDIAMSTKIFITDCLPDSLKRGLEAELFVVPGDVPVFGLKMWVSARYAYDLMWDYLNVKILCPIRVECTKHIVVNSYNGLILMTPFRCHEDFKTTDWCQPDTPCIHNHHNFTPSAAELFFAPILDYPAVLKRNASIVLGFLDDAGDPEITRYVRSKVDEYIAGDDTNKELFSRCVTETWYRYALYYAQPDSSGRIFALTGMHAWARYERKFNFLTLWNAVSLKDYALLRSIFDTGCSHVAFAIVVAGTQSKLDKDIGFISCRRMRDLRQPLNISKDDAVSKLLRMKIGVLRSRLDMRLYIKNLFADRESYFSVVPVDILMMVLDYVWYGYLYTKSVNQH